MIELPASHSLMWDKISNLLSKNRFPQALLFVGSSNAGILHFTSHLIATIMCNDENSPCGKCRVCNLLDQSIHPDINYISIEPPGSMIKIEQIRDLQQNIYQTPKLGDKSFTVIESADKMNIAAANALLKILEEPPSHRIFILIARQISRIPATILSRCQRYVFPFNEIENSYDYLVISESYQDNSPRKELAAKVDIFIKSLCELADGKISPCTIAAEWRTYILEDLLWLLYLITAKAINYKLVGMNLDESKDEIFVLFAKQQKTINLLRQLQQINIIMRNLNSNMNMNQTLVLEDLLLGYISRQLEIKEH